MKLSRSARRCVLTLLGALSIAALPAADARADVKLPAALSDNMVLQQGVPLKIWGWAEPGEQVTVTFGKLTGSATADEKGDWLVKLGKAATSAEPAELIVTGKNTITLKNILVGEVWLCSGQSNMEWAMGALGTPLGKKDIEAANFPKIRLLNISSRKNWNVEPQKDLPAGKTPGSEKRPTWTECTPATAASFSAVGFYFGREINQKLNVPVGLISAAWGGSPIERWIPWDIYQSDPALSTFPPMFVKMTQDLPEALVKYEAALAKWTVERDAIVATQPAAATQPRSLPTKPVQPVPPKEHYGSMYNGNIAPLTNYAIAGVLWYQGEANSGDAKGYRVQFPALIRGWRKVWDQGEFPFYFVQLANYQNLSPNPNHAGGWAGLREAQTATLETPNTGMAVAIDIGDANDIHPRNKIDVGLRLSLWALANTYKQPNVVYSGPLYESLKIEGSKAIISFKHVGSGLKIKGDKLTGFAVAGEDMNYVWADAVIEGQTIVVTSPNVPAPRAVRYGWSSNPACNLYNAADLPASPFRAGETLELPKKN
jgi:sialate O-acetylesterase